MAAWSNVMGAWGEVERLCFRPTPQPLDERLGGGRIADLGAGDDIDEGVAALAPGLRQLGPAVQLLRAVAGFLVLARGPFHQPPRDPPACRRRRLRSEEHTSELQSLMRISYAVFCLKKKKITITLYSRDGYAQRCSDTGTLQRRYA